MIIRPTTERGPEEMSKQSHCLEGVKDGKRIPLKAA